MSFFFLLGKHCYLIPVLSGIYFSVCLALMVISLLETVVITNVLHTNSTKYRDVPHWVRVVVLGFIARLICYRWPEEITSVVQEKPDNSGTRAIQPPAQSTPAHQSRNSEIFVSIP